MTASTVLQMQLTIAIDFVKRPPNRNEAEAMTACKFMLERFRRAQARWKYFEDSSSAFALSNMQSEQTSTGRLE